MFKRIDIHAHANFSAYNADREAVIGRALNDGIAMINVGSQYDTSISAVALTNEYPQGVYATVGLHPIHSQASHHDSAEFGGEGKEFRSRGEIFDVEKYRLLLKNPKVVAIGECGLDYYHLSPEYAMKQKEIFLAQIALADEMKKPLMIHVRQAYDDVWRMLKENGRVKGNIHFFAGTKEQAQAFLDLGFTLSFTGVITFADSYRELVKYTPLDMIQAETDCPYVAPVPYRGQRNEPAYVSYVVAKIAEIKNMAVEKVEEALVKNAERVWGIEL